VSEPTIYEGLVIHTFKDTDVDAYVRMIRDEGFKCYVRTDYLIVGEKLYNPVNKEERARRLRQARKLNGLTRKQVSEQINVKEETIRSWELGRTYPIERNLRKLRDLYRVDL